MLKVLKARCVESGKLLCLDSRSGMLLPPASQAAVSSAPKPKQVHPLSPLPAGVRRGSHPAEAVHCALYRERERELASYGEYLSLSYYLPP